MIRTRTAARRHGRPLTLVAVAAALALAGCGGGDDAGSAGGTAPGTGTGGGDVLEDAALGRDIGVSLRDTALALRGLGGCGRELSCYRAEGAEVARFATAERARLAPRVAQARTPCVRETGRLQLDLLDELARAGTELEAEDYQGVIRTSARVVRRADDVREVAGDCAGVVMP